MNEDPGRVRAPSLPIRTPRLLLRPYRRDDLDYLSDVLSRPEVLRYLYDEPRTRAEFTELLEQRMGRDRIAVEGDQLALVAELEGTGVRVGHVNLIYASEAHSTAEIGWVVHPDHRGHGYATEAGAELLRIGFEELALHRVVARCDARNVGSVAVMERLGMRREARFTENEFVKGEWTDELVYALLAREWQARRDG